MSSSSDEQGPTKGRHDEPGREIDTPMVNAAEDDPDPADHSELDAEPARSDASGDPTGWDESVSPDR
jgi:hypothetical protein